MPIMSKKSLLNDPRSTGVCGTDAPGTFGSVGPVSHRLAEPLALKTEKNKECRLAGWNVRTLSDEVAQSITLRTLLQREVEIACPFELRLPDSGHRIIPKTSSISTKAMERATLRWQPPPSPRPSTYDCLSGNPYPPRLARRKSLRGRVHFRVVPAVYAPIPDEAMKHVFCIGVQRLINETPREDLTIIAGD